MINTQAHSWCAVITLILIVFYQLIVPFNLNDH